MYLLSRIILVMPLTFLMGCSNPQMNQAMIDAMYNYGAAGQSRYEQQQREYRCRVDPQCVLVTPTN
jgi:hypothetical protein